MIFNRGVLLRFCLSVLTIWLFDTGIEIPKVIRNAVSEERRGQLQRLKCWPKAGGRHRCALDDVADRSDLLSLEESCDKGGRFPYDPQKREAALETRKESSAATSLISIPKPLGTCDMIRTPSKSLSSVLARFQKAIYHKPLQNSQRFVETNTRNSSFEHLKFLAQQRTIHSISPFFNITPNSSIQSSHRRGCTSASDTQNTYHGDESALNAQKPIEIDRVPLPPGLSNDRFGLYEVLETSKDMGETKGQNAVVAIHGPPELWLPRGIEEHGASGGLWAVIGTSGTQYKVMKGDVLYTNRQAGEVNTQVAFDWVLAIGAFDWTLFGRPLIRGAKVLATVEEQTKSAKVMVAKFKKRKGYLRRKGHRQPITRFRIDEIVYQWPTADMIKPYEVPYNPRRPPVPHHIRPF